MTSTTLTTVEKPRRKHHSKARTGCITCKIRRVKCDENKPFCVRCTSTGRKCDGYGDSTAKPLNTRLAITGPPSNLFGTAQETEAFQFFCEKTSGMIGACSPHAFWDKAVLPLCHSSPTIKNLVLSMASYHQTMLQPTREVATQQMFYLNHYNMALRDIIKAKDVNVGTLLVACLILTACDDFSGRTMSSLQHATASLRILAAYQARESHLKDSATDEIIQNIIYPVLSFLNTQTAPFRLPDPDNPESHTLKDSFDIKKLRVLQLPSKYDNLQEARHALNILIQGELEDFSEPRRSPGEVLDSSTFLRALNHWISVLDDFLGDPVLRIDADHALTQFMLRNHHLAIGLMVRMNANFDEMMFDFLGLFESVAYKVAPILERYLEDLRSQTTGTGTSTIDYQREDFGFIPPLFFCVTRCRNPRTRRSALQWLYRLQRREGDWNSFMAAKIAETIMNTEEESATSPSTLTATSSSSSTSSPSASSPSSDVRTHSDVPQWVRIRAVAVYIDPHTNQALLKYARWPFEKGGQDHATLIQGWRSDDKRPPHLLSQQLTKLVRLGGYQGLIRGRPMNPSANKRDISTTPERQQSSQTSRRLPLRAASR